MTASEHVAACITSNRRINREFVSDSTGLLGDALTAWIYRAIDAFVYSSMGATGTPGAANMPRGGRLKKEAREAFE